MPYLDLKEYASTARFVDINDHRIAHWTAGEGEVVLFIHGFPSASWDWHHLWSRLSKQYHVIAIDLLGFGLSDKPAPYQYSLLEQCDIIEQVLSLHNITQCHVLAHDYGNSVAQELLARWVSGQQASKNDNTQNNDTQNNNVTINSMCFLNGGLFAESHRPLFTQKLLKSPLGPLVSKFMSRKSLAKSFAKIFAPHSQASQSELDVIWQLLETNNGKAAMHNLLSYIDERHIYRDKWLHAMQHSAAPLYFINGIVDPISGQHMLQRYKELIPNPAAIGIDAGHYPQLETPTQVLNLYSEFLIANKQCK